MRTITASLIAITAFAAPAVANSCYWINGRPYCDSGCWISHRWWDGRSDWMQYHCLPPFLMDPVVIIGAVILAAGLLVSILGAAFSTDTHQADIQQIEHDIAADRNIENDMQDAMRKADAHIAAMLEKYQKGDDRG